MNSKPELSAGCLQKIIKEKSQMKISSTEEKPLVQVLASKVIPSGNIRCVLFDGIHSTNYGILKHSPQIQSYYENHELDKFSVIRLDEYWVTSNGPNDINIIVISHITPIMRGSQINEKLEVFPTLNQSMNQTMDPSIGPSMGQSMGRSFTAVESSASNWNLVNEMKFNTEFNPNYKPRHQTNKESATASIDKSKLCSICDIHPFFNSFVIRVRIATKSAIKTFTGRDGKEGKLFSFDATDETSEIRITAFNTECDKYFGFIEKDLVYYISKGNVKTANKRFSNLKSDYEITLIKDSLIELCDESIPLPSIQFKFLTIAQLFTQSKGNSVDVIGVITSVEPLQEIVSKKDQKEYQKRDIILLDKTLHEVRLTIWAEEAVNFSATTGQIMAVKNAVVGDFRGVTLGCVQNSIIELDPDLPEAHLLKGWYDRESTAGKLKDVIPLSKMRDEKPLQLKYLCQINQQSIPEGSTLYYNCKATIISVFRSDKPLYKSCAKKPCMKKVKEENGFYYCDKCGNNSTEFEWRLMLTLCCADSTSEIWITLFSEMAEKIIGKNATKLSEMFESDPNECQSLISDLHFKSFIFRIGSKVEEYNNEERVKSTCFGIAPIDTIERSKKLIQSLKSWPKPLT